MKEILYGTNEKEPQTEAVAQLAQELYNSGLLSTLVADLQLIDFEVRKEVWHFLVLYVKINIRIPTTLIDQDVSVFRFYFVVTTHPLERELTFPNYI